MVHTINDPIPVSYTHLDVYKRQGFYCTHFVHCYALQLNLLMQTATSQNIKAKIFSQIFLESNFFPISIHRCDVLEEIVKCKLPRVVAGHWNYNICSINSVFENLGKLVECFEEVEKNCHNTITRKEVYSVYRTLEDPDFVFWLHCWF